MLIFFQRHSTNSLFKGSSIIREGKVTRVSNETCSTTWRRRCLRVRRMTSAVRAQRYGCLHESSRTGGSGGTWAWRSNFQDLCWKGHPPARPRCTLEPARLIVHAPLCPQASSSFARREPRPSPARINSSAVLCAITFESDWQASSL